MRLLNKRLKQKVGIIGHFGGNRIFADGQTIKTKVLYEELNSNTDWDIICVDTYYKNNPIKLFIQSLNCIIRCNDIIILLSRNGLKIYLPILFLCKKLFKKNIYHDVIGGNDMEILQKYPRWIKYLSSFEVNWYESPRLAKDLKNIGIANAEYLPNFKNIKCISENEINEEFQEPFKFCTFSRVSISKGIPEAIKTISELNHYYGKKCVVLDIYGQIEEGFEDEFSKLIKENKDFVCYKGIVNFKESVSTLKGYFALLFPTHFQGEGFPGTILDAYSSGLPIIATDWSLNSEIIHHMRTGLIYENTEFKDLNSAIQWSINNLNEMQEFRKNCLEEAKKYSAEALVKIIVDRVNKNNICK